MPWRLRGKEVEINWEEIARAVSTQINMGGIYKLGGAAVYEIEVQRVHGIIWEKGGNRIKDAADDLNQGNWQDHCASVEIRKEEVVL